MVPGTDLTIYSIPAEAEAWASSTQGGAVRERLRTVLPWVSHERVAQERRNRQEALACRRGAGLRAAEGVAVCRRETLSGCFDLE